MPPTLFFMVCNQLIKFSVREARLDHIAPSGTDLALGASLGCVSAFFCEAGGLWPAVPNSVAGIKTQGGS